MPSQDHDVDSDEEIPSPMFQELPRLAFIPVKNLVVHETHDAWRTLPLIRRIQSSGVFRNPPIVTPLPDSTGRYMVLDGANRTAALKELGAPHALVQITQPDDPGLNLLNWNHVIWEMDSTRLVEGMGSIPGTELVPVEDPGTQPGLMDARGPVIVQLPDDIAYIVLTPQRNVFERVGLLNAIVDSYRDNARFDRTTAQNIKPLKQIYPQLGGLVIFPHFNISDLLMLAGRGCLLPTGITRFVISPRVLHLNYPLEELAADKPLSIKNQELRRWIQDRLAHKHVRYYAESTFLFDE